MTPPIFTDGESEYRSFALTIGLGLESGCLASQMNGFVKSFLSVIFWSSQNFPAGVFSASVGSADQRLGGT
jgi:hypothetical protein